MLLIATVAVISETNDPVHDTEQQLKVKEVTETDDLIKAALGVDPEESDVVDIFIPKDVEKRLSKVICAGLRQDILEGLLLQYKPPDCFKVPMLNNEIKFHIHDGAKKRDEFLYEAQRLTFMSMSLLGGLLGGLMDKSIEIDPKSREHFIGVAMEAALLQGQHAYEQTQTRKSFILPAIKNQPIKDLLKDQETDEYLFGKDLHDKLAALEKVKKACKQFGNDSSAKPQNSAKNFFENRANHPRRMNKPWSGQGTFSNRWNYKTKIPYMNQQNPSSQKGFKNNKKG